MQQTSAVSTLNDVLQTLRDSEEGFRTAAGAVKDGHIKHIFEQYSRQRGEMAREIEQEIGKLGGTAGTAGSVSGSLHRSWMNLKGAVGAVDDKAIISERPQAGSDRWRAPAPGGSGRHRPARARRGRRVEARFEPVILHLIRESRVLNHESRTTNREPDWGFAIRDSEIRG
jgi:uncharacterized protein (TIGR02284 family)